MTLTYYERTSAAFGCMLGWLVLVAAGCSPQEPRRTSDEPIGGDPFACSAEDGLETESIADFESGIATGFYTNNDGSEGSIANPPAGASSPLAEELNGGRCGVSQRALHLTGSGFTDWGMVWGKNFDGAPVDYSEWDGISFWARRGSDSGTSLFFSVTDINTDPLGDKCLSEPEELKYKCDAYGAGLGLEEEWRFFQVPFASLRQRGFGVITSRFESEAIVGIGWAAGPGNWDVWIDNVSLYRGVDGAGGSSGTL